MCARIYINTLKFCSQIIHFVIKTLQSLKVFVRSVYLRNSSLDARGNIFICDSFVRRGDWRGEIKYYRDVGANAEWNSEATTARHVICRAFIAPTWMHLLFNVARCVSLYPIHIRACKTGRVVRSMSIDGKCTYIYICSSAGKGRYFSERLCKGKKKKKK